MLIPKHNATNTADKAPCFLTLGIRRRRIDTLSVRQWPEIAQSVLRLAKEWMVRESNVGGGRYFPRQTITALGLTQPPAQWVRGLFLRGETAGSWRSPPTPSSAEVKERVELYLYSPFGSSWQDVGWSLSFFTLLNRVNIWTSMKRESQSVCSDKEIIQVLCQESNLRLPVQNMQEMLSSVIRTLSQRRAVLTPSTAQPSGRP